MLIQTTTCQKKKQISKSPSYIINNLKYYERPRLLLTENLEGTVNGLKTLAPIRKPKKHAWLNEECSVANLRKAWLNDKKRKSSREELINA